MAPKKLPVRPTTDMAKEGLFNILNNRYDFGDLNVLDLFAGTGNISYEFASRGVQNITSVDAHSGCVGYISKTAKMLEMPITPIKSDAFRFLKRNQSVYDLIFADPPYNLDSKEFANIPELVFANNLISADGVLIVEHGPQTTMAHCPNFVEGRKYGGSVFSFFSNINK